MRNIWITVSYEGTNYAGFQRQPTRMTVQEMLENTLLQLTGKKTTIYFVARTDAGVHAYGQECTFYTESRIPQDRFVHAMNALLPHDIRVRQSREMDEDFSVRRRNFGKTYGYLLTESREASPFLVRTIWRTGKQLDLAKMEAIPCGLSMRSAFGKWAPSSGSTSPEKASSTTWSETSPALSLMPGAASLLLTISNGFWKPATDESSVSPLRRKVLPFSKSISSRLRKKRSMRHCKSSSTHGAAHRKKSVMQKHHALFVFVLP